MRKTNYLLTFLFMLLPGCVTGSPTGPVPLSGDVNEASGWTKELVVRGLEHPWGMVWLPDGKILVTERPGRMRYVSEGKIGEPLANVPEVFAEGQGGLLDVSLHPKFAENKLVYFTYSAGDDDANHTELARARLTETTLEDVEVLYRVNIDKSGTQHFGSRIVWVSDTEMLVSIGDGGNPPVKFQGKNIRTYSQDRRYATGKVIRLRDDGTPGVAGFSAAPDTLPEVWSVGHRNIQGMVRDSAGRVWANEHGARGGDELNLIEGGKDYGWPSVTYSREYWGPRISDETSAPGTENPRLVWTPSKAPSGLAYYSGDIFPQWKGDLFSGALKFYHIRRIDLDGTKVVGEDKLTIGERVRDVRQGPDGYLYVLTDQNDGALFKLVPAQKTAK